MNIHLTEIYSIAEFAHQLTNVLFLRKSHFTRDLIDFNLS